MIIDFPDDPKFWHEKVPVSGEPMIKRKEMLKALFKSTVMESKESKIKVLQEKLEKLSGKKVTLQEFYNYSPEEVITTLHRGKAFDVERSLNQFASENPDKADRVKAVVGLVKEYEQSRMSLKDKEDQIEAAILALKGNSNLSESDHHDCGCGCGGAGTCKPLKENVLKEGTWALPYTAKKANKIGLLLQGLLKGDYTTEKVTDALYNLYGDDMLFDELASVNKNYVGIVQKHIKGLIAQYEKHPEQFDSKFEPEALEALRKVLFLSSK